MTETAQKEPACAICGKPVDPAHKPFCSKRCANVDLHRWLTGSYVIAGDKAEEISDLESDLDLAPLPPDGED